MNAHCKKTILFLAKCIFHLDPAQPRSKVFWGRGSIQTNIILGKMGGISGTSIVSWETKLASFWLFTSIPISFLLNIIANSLELATIYYSYSWSRSLFKVYQVWPRPSYIGSINLVTDQGMMSLNKVHSMYSDVQPIQAHHFQKFF